MSTAFVLAVVRLCGASFWTTGLLQRLWSVYTMQAFGPQPNRSACGPSIRCKFSDHRPIAAPVVCLCDASFQTTVQSKRLWSVYTIQAFRPQPNRSACGPPMRCKLLDHSSVEAPVVRLCSASFWTTVPRPVPGKSPVERPLCGKNRRQKDPQLEEYQRSDPVFKVRPVSKCGNDQKSQDAKDGAQPEIQGSPIAAGKFPGILIFARHSCPVSGQTVSVFCALTAQSAGPPAERPRASPYSSTTGA